MQLYVSHHASWARGLEEAFELFLEARQASTTVHQLLVAARPCRMRAGIDIQSDGVAFLAVGRVRDELGAVGHDDFDLVVMRVKIWVLIHRAIQFSMQLRRANSANGAFLGGDYGISSGLDSLKSSIRQGDLGKSCSGKSYFVEWLQLPAAYWPCSGLVAVGKVGHLATSACSGFEQLIRRQIPANWQLLMSPAL